MVDFDTKFTFKSTEWETPSEIFDPLDKEFHFTLDVCASEKNKKCSVYYTKEEDGLKQNWGGISKEYCEIARKRMEPWLKQTRMIEFG